MSDTDRLLNTAHHQGRTLDDGCSACGFSAVYCRCVTYIDGPGAACCSECDH